MPTWQARLRDARNFRTVASVVADPEHGNQAASNAILGAIAANDAICLHLGHPSLRATHTSRRLTRWSRRAGGSGGRQRRAVALSSWAPFCA